MKIISKSIPCTVSLSLACFLSFSSFAGNSVLLGVDYDAEKPLVKKPILGEATETYSEGKLDDNTFDEATTEGVVTKIGAELKSSAPEVVLTNGGYRFYSNSKNVEFDLSKGLLKYQVSNLLLNHELIGTLDDIQWSASDNFVWPNNFTVKGQSFDHVLNQILKPYKLIAQFKGNGSVIVTGL
ncbi:hypothetical protein FQP81_18255 [Pseudoalteromonas distincta]|uniref:hypothetical protein n=1 Tax=Pseudoalteromonas distincta TaxID=77608 RepID=UPI001195F250|nr:hypothetical protein [Pseudoalteromonas elyakovii]TVU70399.1 hypothetical protein FQP81_18255 [Pseudoalteromonas elyakovii]